MDVANAPEERTILQKQTNKIVRTCAIIAGILFLLVCIVTYFNISNYDFKGRIIESILSGITLAMGTIPEEFPVVLTVFLSMGAWRLAKKKSLIKKLPSVETLGAVSVLCVDKTGTITKNQMTVEEIWGKDIANDSIIKIMGMACESEAYDPMEKAMLEYCDKNGFSKEELFNGKMIKEYPFTNELKMMGHVWDKENRILIASKGAPESILEICNISENEKTEVTKKVFEMASKGMRVIAIAMKNIEKEEELEEDIRKCKLILCGLVRISRSSKRKCF